MEAALFGLAALACPLGMLAMMGGMMWMSRRSGSDTDDAPGTEVGEVSHV